MIFDDRKDGAKQLIERLRKDRWNFDVVLALPRGGVILGKMVAEAFHKPLDLAIPRKIGAPGNEEYAIGAIAESGEAVWNEEEKARVDEAWLRQAVEKERAEAIRRRTTYLKGRARVPIRGKRVLIVDDGMATGLTMKAAVMDVKTQGASWIGIAVPVSPPDTVNEMKSKVDQCLALSMPEIFFAVGGAYQTFGQVSDDEVVQLLKEKTTKV